MPEPRIPVAYRAVVLAGVLLVLGLLFRQLATLLLAMLTDRDHRDPAIGRRNEARAAGCPAAARRARTLLLGLACWRACWR